MVFPVLAAMALGGALGGLGGKQKAKASGKPTVTTSKSQLNPAMQLGGWDRLNEALARMRDIQPYRPGQNNPYLGATFGHILGRAGVQAPEGGWQMPQYGGFQAPPPQMQPPPQGGGYDPNRPFSIGDPGGGGQQVNMQSNPYLARGAQNVRKMYGGGY